MKFLQPSVRIRGLALHQIKKAELLKSSAFSFSQYVIFVLRRFFLPCAVVCKKIAAWTQTMRRLKKIFVMRFLYLI